MKKLFSWTKEMNNKFWLRVSESTSADAHSLCVYRIIAGLSLLTINFESFSYIGDIPQAFFNPPFLSIANFFKGFPSNGFFVSMELLLIIAALFITVGIKTRISTFIYIIISILALNFKYSLGKIDHTFILYALLFCMSFSGWGRSLALVPDKIMNIDSAQKSLSLLSVLICFSFFSAGFEKALRWVNFDFTTTGSGRWFYDGYYILERHYLLAPFFKHLPFWGFKIMDFLAVPFELSPLFFLLTSKKAWRTWLLIASCFHLANTLILNITFTFISVVYLVFVDYTVVFSKIKYLFSLKFVKPAIFLIMSFIVIIRIKYCFSSASLMNSVFKDKDLVAVDLYFSVSCWVLIIALLCRNAFGKTFIGYYQSFKQIT